jgi:hypothetical protein
MCEFISWKEFKTDAGTEILFLTYDQIYNSKRGRELQKYTTPDDFIGHGAIDFYYELGGKGQNRECTDFSTPGNFPPEIVEAIKAGKFYLMGSPERLLKQSALAEYKKIKQSAYAEYEKIDQPALAEYEKIQQSAYAEYEKIEQPAYAEYKKIKQEKFWELFFVPENRAEVWR